MKLVIATSNLGKLGEIKSGLGVVPFEIVSSGQLGLSDDYEEVGEDHEFIAKGKALHYFKQSGLMTLAEDSGIVVDALANELGVKTRRWGAGDKASDEVWVEYFLDRMKDVSDKQRGARFMCVAALVLPNGDVKTFFGVTEGFITRALEAPIKKGLPLSSCFIPKGSKKVYAALTEEEKNMISHRGRAIRAVRDFLRGI